MYPYSYTCEQEPHNLEDLEEIAIGLAKAFRLTNGHFYSVDSACSGIALSAASSSRDQNDKIQMKITESGGSALDYFYSEIQVKYSFQIKLRDTGTYGFLLPKENIVPTGIETFEAMIGLGKWLLGNRGIEGYTDLSTDPIWGKEETYMTHENSDSTAIDEDDEEDGYWWRRRR